MTRTAIQYRTQTIKNRHMYLKKRTRVKRDLTHIFFGCLRYTLTGLGIISIFVSSIMIYKELLQLPWLRVKKIQVEGCVNHTPAEILDIAGIRPQANLLSLNLQQICQHLESSPWIETARVKRTFPDQLYIGISERKPAALINLNQLHLVDRNGVIFKKADPQEGQGLPIVTGIDWESLMNHKKKFTGFIKEALALLGLFEQQGLHPSYISEIHVNPTLGLTVYTTNNTLQIVMGFSPFQKKCKRLYEIMDDLKGKTLTPQKIDLNYQHKAFVKIKQSSKTKKSI